MRAARRDAEVEVGEVGDSKLPGDAGDRQLDATKANPPRLEPTPGERSAGNDPE
jgi:hypothetical protein